MISFSEFTQTKKNAIKYIFIYLLIAIFIFSFLPLVIVKRFNLYIGEMLDTNYIKLLTVFFTASFFFILMLQEKASKNLKGILLIGILFLGFILRFKNLEILPLGIYIDEASAGYNAYLISETGKDMHAKFYPIFFTALGDFRSPVIIYLTSIAIKIFGPTIAALRISSCIFGTVAIFFTYKLSRLFFKDYVAFIATFLLAISPWHINFSRIALDKVFMPTFFIMGLYYLCLGLKKEKKYIIFSSVPFAVCLYSYGTARAFLPLFLLVFILFNLKNVLKYKKEFIISSLTFVFLLIPFASEIIQNPSINKRSYELSIIHPVQIERERSALLHEGVIVGSRFELVARAFLKNYLIYFSPSFLIEQGDSIIRHNPNKRGQIYFSVYILSMLGLIYLLFQIFIYKRKELLLFIYWFLIFPIPAALTNDAIPHAGRSIGGLPLFQILAAVGVLGLVEVFNFSKVFFKERFFSRYAFKSIVVLYFVFLSLILYFESNVFMKYYFKGDFNKDAHWHYDYDIYAITKVFNKYKDEYRLIIPGNYWKIHHLYVSKKDPHEYFDELEGKKVGTKKVAKIVEYGNEPELKTIAIVKNDLLDLLRFEIKEVKN